ncbi:hypothetical protein JCM3765_001331 [Sporobolomyces pararoseus]
MSARNKLSPEILEDIIVQTLDYSYKLNYRQLKRLQLVSKFFDQASSRDSRVVSMDNPEHVGASGQVLQSVDVEQGETWPSRYLDYREMPKEWEKKIFAATPLCADYQGRYRGREELKIGRKDTYDPFYPTTERLVVMDPPKIVRPPRTPPPGGGFRNRLTPSSGPHGPPTLDENGVEIPRVRPNSAIDHLSSLPTSVKHLTLVANNLSDFTSAQPTEFPLDRLSTIELVVGDRRSRATAISEEWHAAIVSPSLANKTLKVIKCYNAKTQTFFGFLKPFELHGSSLRELTVWDTSETRLEGHDFHFVDSILRDLHNLETLDITRHEVLIRWSQLPRNLRNLTVRGYQELDTELRNICQHITSGSAPHIQQLTFSEELHQNNGYSPSFPRSASSPPAPPPTDSTTPFPVTLTHLRIENCRVRNSAALHKLVDLCSPTLRYLAFHDLGILNPWDSIALCTSLRWLELGTIRAMMRDPEYSEDEDSDSSRPPKEQPDYGERRRRALAKFLQTVFPHLDYLYLHLGDSFALNDAANRIHHRFWPSLKVLDLGWIDRGGIYESESQKDANGIGLEQLISLSRVLGFTLAVEGDPIDGWRDLWKRMLKDREWNDNSFDD